MHRLARFARLDDKARASARPFANQMVMHGAGREQRRNCRMLRVHTTIRKHDNRVAGFDRVRGAIAQCVERGAKPSLAIVDAVQGRKRDRAQTFNVEPLDPFEFLVGENRLLELKLAAVTRRLLEQIMFGANRRFGRGHQFLANRIDRRIRHLREQLFEVVVKRLRLVRQYGERSVRAHRSNRLLPIGRHRREDRLEILDGVAERLLLLEQLVVFEVVNRRRAARFGQRLEGDQAAVEPRAIRLPCRHRLS